MRGLDTNVLLRYLTTDDPEQSPRVERLLENAEERGETFHVSVVVLVELMWTLARGRYRYTKEELLEVLGLLLDTPLFHVQERDAVRRAILRFRSGGADFPDYLIGELDRGAGAEVTLTFDRRLGAEAGFKPA